MNQETLEFVPALHDKMLRQRYLLCYKGTFSQSVTRCLLAITENKLNNENIDLSLKKKVFSIMVNCLQNICMTSESNRILQEHESILMLGKNETDIFIYCGSVLRQDKAAELKPKLIAINTMNKQDLKILFTEMIIALNQNEIPESQIALVDIARKSGRKLDYDFRPIDETSTFFSMKTVIASAS